MDQNTQNTNTDNQEVKEKIIGEFKPKRKFLNFVSAVNNARVRLISDIAFIKGETITGIGLDGVIFKVTICDEGTINFEEVDTKVTDKEYRQRIINDICDMDVTGYAQKFIVAGLEFADKDGKRSYLEVEYTKPIDKLMGIFEKPTTEVSEKGLSFLDELLGSSTTTEETTSQEESIEAEKKEVVDVEEKSHSQSMMEESFRKMNEDKINELKSRVETKEKDIQKYKRDISFAESKMKEASDQLGVLNTRLETLSPADEPNGYVFFITEEQKHGVEADDKTKEVVGKIAELMHLKADVVIDYLTKGFYVIKIAKKGEVDKPLDKIEREIYEKISSIDALGKFTAISNGEFEYRGDLNWHQLVSKMIRKGFEQEPEFDKLAGSNSYESKEEDKIEEKCDHNGCGCHEKKEETEIKSEASTEFKGKTLLKIEDPKDIVILGSYTEGDTLANFSITDDFSSFDIMIGKSEFKFKMGGYQFNSVESDGFVNVLTVPEFIKLKNKIEKDQDIEDFFQAIGAVFLPNFKGEIKVGAKKEDGTYTNNFEFNEYIQHQFDNDYVNVVVSLPEGTEAMIIEPKDFMSMLRDGKINTILN